MKIFKVILMPVFLLTVGLAASSCTSHYDKNLGSKIMLNKSAQVVDADAVYEEEGHLATLEGQKAEKLLLRYRNEDAAAPTESMLKDIGDN